MCSSDLIGIYETIVGVARYISLERAAARVAKSGEVQTLGPSLRGRLSFNVVTALVVSFVCISIIGFRFQELPFASVRTPRIWPVRSTTAMIASVLGVSPALMQAYVSAAAKISRLAVGKWHETTGQQ